jgi:2-iminobutanoate/2-iminopropanoate deaminase
MGRTEGRTNRSPAPVGPYSQAVRTGQLVPVAGHAGVDPLTGDVVSAEVRAQTEQTLKNVAGALAACGTSLDDLVRVDVLGLDGGP